MKDARFAAVGGTPTFAPLVARVAGTSAEDVMWLPSVAAAEKAIADGVARFDVLVVAPNVVEGDALAVAGRISREAPATAVLVAREGPVDGEFPRLIRGGVRDVVDLTKGSNEFRDALERAAEWAAGLRGTAAARGEANGAEGAIVVVFTTKGGTGKTFLSCNLAAALAERTQQQVALLDLDHDLGDVFAYFGETPKRSLQELVFLGDAPTPEDVVQLGTPLIDNVLGFGSTPDPNAEPIPAGTMTKFLRTMKQAFPFTVVDGTAEYSDHVLAAFDIADAVVLVAALDAISVRHMTLAKQTLGHLGISNNRIRLVLNRADSRVDLTPDDVERLLGIAVNARIPSSPLVPRSVNRARLLYEEERKSEVAKAIEGLAAQLQTELAPQLGTVSTNGTKHRLLRRG